MASHKTKNNAPRISVVIPNHNHNSYLKSTITAFARQSLTPNEIIVVDDGSTDESWSTISTLAQEIDILIPIKRKKRGGIHAAVANGLKVATGEFVSLSAADDIFSIDFLKRSVEALKRFPEAAFAFSIPATLSHDGSSKLAVPHFKCDESVYLSPDVVTEMLRRASFTFAANTVVYRREKLNEMEGFRPALHWHADWLLNMGLALRYGACYVPQVLSHFREQPDSYSAISMASKHGRTEIIKNVLEIIYLGDCQDIGTRFRGAAILPEYELNTAFELRNDPVFRSHVTTRLLRRILARHFWSRLRPYSPFAFRRALHALGGARRKLVLPPDRRRTQA